MYIVSFSVSHRWEHELAHTSKNSDHLRQLLSLSITAHPTFQIEGFQCGLLGRKELQLTSLMKRHDFQVGKILVSEDTFVYQARQLELHPERPHSGSRELIPSWCPLTPTPHGMFTPNHRINVCHKDVTSRTKPHHAFRPISSIIIKVFTVHLRLKGRSSD